VAYDPAAAGQSGKGIQHWGFDVKDVNQGSLANSVAHAGGSASFDMVRVAWYPEYGLLNNGTTLDPQATALMDTEASMADQIGSSLPLFLSPKTGTIASYYVGSNGKVDVNAWVKGMQLSRDYYVQQHGKTIQYNGPTNEPDNTNNKFDPSDFVSIRNALSGWGSVTEVGPCTFQAEDGAAWLPTMHASVGHASTHAIGDTTLAAYKGFASVAAGYSLAVWNSEVHSLAEALVGGDLGFRRGIWWAPITTERGDFVIYGGNPRVFYAEFGTWGATAAYLDSAPNSLFIFIGNKDSTTAYTLRFSSTGALVHYDGGAAKASHTVTIPKGGEQVIHVTW
jgi:hypothetical protein